MAITDFFKNVYVAWGLIGGISALAVSYYLYRYFKKLFAGIKEEREKRLKEKPLKEIVYVDRYLDSDLTELKNLKKKKFYYEAKDRDFFAKRGSFFLNLLDIKGFLKRRLRRKHPEKVVLIRMEMNNGQFREFLVAEDEKEGFKQKNKKYIFDLDARYFVIDSNIWAYDYHESFTLPIKRRIPINDIKLSLEQSNITEVENFVNPVTAERFVKSEIAQGILQGTMIGKLFKVMLILMIIVLVAVAINLVFTLMDSGALADLMAKANQ